MKKLCLQTLILLLTVSFPVVCLHAQWNPEEVLRVISRFTDQQLPLKLCDLPKNEGKDQYEISVKNGKVKIKASSGVAACRAFYDYTKKNRLGFYSWNGKRFDAGGGLPNMNVLQVKSPFEHHYYFNVVTYGYTMPYWDWARWEQEIDWMALHGIDMPLALVANEAIIARVWKRMGLTDEEINLYFVAPAHLPWMRMGNLSQIDPALTKEWHRSQVALQHQILKRMRALGMKPICPAFAGFVPKAMKRLYPEINIVQTSWAGNFHNWMLEPQEELFHTIGTEFIKEWEKEFGKNDYYLADSFNEMEIPFPPVGSKERYDLLASYGDKLYRSIRDANKDAVWVMQGWMFGYMRNVWEPATLQALLSKVPDDKMLLLDLAEDYNHHFWHNGNNWDFYNGFYGKNWIYSVIPNMGGKTGMTGFADFYANGHLPALTSANKRNLVGHGLAPEGIENNELLYELITDAGWSDQKINTDQWYHDYAQARYGKTNPALQQSWEYLKKSVYGSFTDHPRFNWQVRPGRIRKGTVNVNPDFYKAVETFASCNDYFRDVPLYQTDLMELTAMYVGGKMEELIQYIQDALQLNNKEVAQQQFDCFIKLGEGLDQLLSTHPTHRLDYWVRFAENASSDPVMKKKYQSNAKRLVTIWGPPIDDYSVRIWSGLIGDYYLPRWKMWFDEQMNNRQIDFASWEANWVKKDHVYTNTCSKLTQEKQSLALLDLATQIALQQAQRDANTKIFANWSNSAFTGNEGEVTFAVTTTDLKNLSGLKLVRLTGNENLKIKQIELIADGQTVFSLNNLQPSGNFKYTQLFPLDIPSEITLNNGGEIRIRVAASKGDDSKGEIQGIYL